MERKLGLYLAVAVLALSISMDSAHAQGRRHNNGGSNIGAFIAGVVAGAVTAVVAGTLINGTRTTIEDACPDVFEDDLDDGYESEFDGKGYRGNCQVVNQGRHPRYQRCRQIRTIVYNRYGEPISDERSRHIKCQDPRQQAWIELSIEERREYVVVPRRQVRPPVRRTYEPTYRQAPVDDRYHRPSAPRYAPYQGPQQGRPQYAPGVLPMAPQGAR